MLDRTEQAWPDDVDTGSVAGITPAQLKSYIERVEHTDAQIAELNADKRDIYAEAKGNGFDVPAIKAIVKIRKEDADKRQQHDAIVGLYLQVLGMPL